MGSSFIHLIRTDSNEFFFNSWVIFHGVYVPQLSYPFICWWAYRLIPCPGYYKQCCDEHWGARVYLNYLWHFISINAQVLPQICEPVSQGRNESSIVLVFFLSYHVLYICPCYTILYSSLYQSWHNNFKMLLNSICSFLNCSLNAYLPTLVLL